MLRILSSKIFREDLSEYALPMYAFENFDDVSNMMNMDNGTYKFCLPVSVGDFAEINVPACFSNNAEKLRKFVDTQINLNNRKAFIISDFQVSDLSKVRFSGIIITSSKKGISNYIDKSTSINLTFKNPILTYANEGISPRDLPADVEFSYDRISDSSHAFPKVSINKKILSLEQYKNIIYQAYMASVKIHEVSEIYDGSEYAEYTLFYVDDKNNIRLYEIVGEESFLAKSSCNKMMIRNELDIVTMSDGFNHQINGNNDKILRKKR